MTETLQPQELFTISYGRSLLSKIEVSDRQTYHFTWHWSLKNVLSSIIKRRFQQKEDLRQIFHEVWAGLSIAFKIYFQLNQGLMGDVSPRSSIVCKHPSLQEEITAKGEFSLDFSHGAQADLYNGVKISSQLPLGMTGELSPCNAISIQKKC